MLSLWLFGIYIVIFCYILYNYCTYRPPNFPPGPPRIPLVGSYLFLLLVNSQKVHLAILKLCKWYNTKVLGFYIGDTPTIVANDYESVRGILFNQAFDGRPDIFVAKMRDPNYETRGIFFVDGTLWKEQRRFTLRHLRDYGFGRRFESLENEIKDEIMCFLNLIKDGPKYKHEQVLFKAGGLVHCPKAFFMCLGNCALQVLFGERFSRHEQDILAEIGELGILFQRTGSDYGRLLSVIPWIRYLFPDSCGFNKFKHANRGLYHFMKKLVDKQLSTFSSQENRNFLDIYFREMKTMNNCEERGFYYEQLILACLDMFFPALTAIGAQSTFLFEICIKNPEIKMRIQKEIATVVGQGRLPHLDDRKNMPYTEACLRELMRYETLAPSSLPHKALYATTFQGYTVPKDCLMIPSLYALHFDENVWNDPHKFLPERFLGDDGQLSLKKDKSLPFGAGKRICAGETFARNTMFLFLTAIFQNFDFELEKGTCVDKLIRTSTVGFISSTPDFWLKFISR